MRNTVFDYVGNLDTLIAVIIGAVLATLGALFAEIIQDRRVRKRAARDAARFFGDILGSIQQVLSITYRSRTIGDPWGGVTVRLFSLALKEAAIYERNRERLFDIDDLALRNEINNHVMQMSFRIEAIVEGAQSLLHLREQRVRAQNVKKPNLDLLAELDGRLDNILTNRKQAIVTLHRLGEKTQDILKRLEIIAQIQFPKQEITPLSIAKTSGVIDEISAKADVS